MKRTLTDEQHRALKAKAGQMSVPQLAREFGIRPMTVRTYLKRDVPQAPSKSGSGQIAGPTYASGYRSAVHNVYSNGRRKHAVVW